MSTVERKIFFKGTWHTVRNYALPLETYIYDAYYASEGDTIVSANGWYLPVLSVTVDARGYRHVQLPRVRLRVTKPGKVFIFEPEKNRFAHVYDQDYKERGSILTPNKKLVAQGILRGISITEACRAVYKRHGVAMAHKLLVDAPFLHYLFMELDFMGSLREALERRQITIDKVAEKIEDILEEGSDYPPMLVKWALDAIVNANKESDVSSTPSHTLKTQLSPLALESGTDTYVDEGRSVLERMMSAQGLPSADR